MDWQSKTPEELIVALKDCDLDVPEGLPEEIVRRGGEMVDPLCAFFSEAWLQEGREEEVAYWTHIHALHLVGAIGDVRAVPSLVGLLRLDSENDEKFLGDWLTELMDLVIAKLPPEAIDPFKEVVRDESLGLFHRFEAAQGIFGIACRHPACRPDVMRFTIQMVRESTDREFVSFLVGLLPQMDVPEARKAFDAAFAQGKVDETVERNTRNAAWVRLMIPQVFEPPFIPAESFLPQILNSPCMLGKFHDLHA